MDETIKDAMRCLGWPDEAIQRLADHPKPWSERSRLHDAPVFVERDQRGRLDGRVVTADGAITFFEQGEVHREGGPSHITLNGEAKYHYRGVMVRPETAYPEADTPQAKSVPN